MTSDQRVTKYRVLLDAGEQVYVRILNTLYEVYTVSTEEVLVKRDEEAIAKAIDTLMSQNLA
jgi:hypothetical protein